MRVLLINEASGVHAYLKRGLAALGHEVVLANTARPNSQLRPTDISFAVVGATKLHRLASIVGSHFKLRSLERFDIANYINTLSIFANKITRYSDIDILKKSGTLLSYYGLACDEAALLRVRPDAAALACPGCMQYDKLGRACAETILARRPKAANYAGNFDFSVSSAYVYAHCHSFFPHAVKANIQLPVDVSTLPFRPALGKSKPLIVHSPTRRGFKGTYFVLEALKILTQWRSDFEFRLVEDLSHAAYLEVMRDCDIYIDQVHSEDAHGVAALENLACGKVVISGNGQLNSTDFPFVAEAPIVRASADPQTLARRIGDILDRKNEFEMMADAGRRYVSKHHDHITVASKFVDLWKGSTPPAAATSKAPGGHDGIHTEQRRI